MVLRKEVANAFLRVCDGSSSRPWVVSASVWRQPWTYFHSVWSFLLFVVQFEHLRKTKICFRLGRLPLLVGVFRFQLFGWWPLFPNRRFRFWRNRRLPCLLLWRSWNSRRSLVAFAWGSSFVHWCVLLLNCDRCWLLYLNILNRLRLIRLACDCHGHLVLKFPYFVWNLRFCLDSLLFEVARVFLHLWWFAFGWPFILANSSNQFL